MPYTCACGHIDNTVLTLHTNDSLLVTQRQFYSIFYKNHVSITT